MAMANQRNAARHHREHRREYRREHRLGLVLVTGSAIAYSTAGFFTRLIPLDVWSLLFWRGLFAGAFMALLLIGRGLYRANRSLPGLYRRPNAASWMIAGLSTAQALAAENRDLIVFAHPTMGGAARIAPPALMRLFRLVGGDVGVFPNYGGRFGYSKETCLALAQGLRAPWGALKDTIPTPAGGMTTARVGEMLDAYGADTMLLIGGALLSVPPERLVVETAAFVAAVGQSEGKR